MLAVRTTNRQPECRLVRLLRTHSRQWPQPESTGIFRSKKALKSSHRLLRRNKKPSTPARAVEPIAELVYVGRTMPPRPLLRSSTRDLRAFVIDQAGAPDAIGRKLPTEREFAERFALPRNAVRRTLADLEAEGCIRREVGRGTFVASPSAPSAGEALAAPRASPAELMDARLRIEPAAVELIVVNATPTDFERMDHCLARAEAALTLGEFELWDAALHQTLAAASHNALIMRIFDLFHAARQQTEFGKLRDRIVTEPLRLDYQRQHRAIVAALKARDATAARAAIVAHLTCAHRNLFLE